MSSTSSHTNSTFTNDNPSNDLEEKLTSLLGEVHVAPAQTHLWWQKGFVLFAGPSQPSSECWRSNVRSIRKGCWRCSILRLTYREPSTSYNIPTGAQSSLICWWCLLSDGLSQGLQLKRSISYLWHDVALCCLYRFNQGQRYNDVEDWRMQEESLLTYPIVVFITIVIFPHKTMLQLQLGVTWDKTSRTLDCERKDI